MSSTDALSYAHATIDTVASDQLLPNSTDSSLCCLQLPVSQVIRQSMMIITLNSILVCILTIGPQRMVAVWPDPSQTDKPPATLPLLHPVLFPEPSRKQKEGLFDKLR